MCPCGESSNFWNFCQACKHPPDHTHMLPNPAPESTHGHHSTCCTKFTRSLLSAAVYSQARTYPMKMFFSSFHFKNENLGRIQKKRRLYCYFYNTEKAGHFFCIYIPFIRLQISSHIAEYTSNYHFCKTIEYRFCWSYTT